MTKPEGLASRFTKADAPAKQRLIWAGVGEPGTGKTSFALGAPGPLVIQSFNRGLEGVVQQYQSTKDIYVREYAWQPGIDRVLEQQAAIDLREQFTEDFQFALANARTVIWDLESEVWDLFKYAEFGFSEAGVPKDWDALKGRIRNLINDAKDTDINFGLLQGMRNEWVPQINKKTGAKGITQSGRRIRAGMDEIEGLVNVNLYHERVKVPGEPSVFQFEVGKARGPASKDVQDQTFAGLSFQEFAMLVFSDSVEEDWL